MTSADDAAAQAWREMQRIVDGALDRPAEERARYVEQSCGGDAALRERVTRLLASCEAAERSAGVLSAPAAEFAAPLVGDIAAYDAAARRAALAASLQQALDGRYTVERELARGGMALVFLARDLRHEREVAIKVLDQEIVAPAGAARFLREIRTAAGFQHPHVLSVFDSGEARGLLYYVMPYVGGETLRARLVREGALPLSSAVRLLRELADALAYAHARGVVHRDIKPENVLLSGDHAVVTDFGIARAMAAATQEGAPGGVLTAAGVTLGTPAYMAPEQGGGDPAADHRVDLYALGVVAYEVLAGRHPFADRDVIALLAAHATEVPEPLERHRPDVPPALAALVMRLLEKRPADRPATADEVMRTLDAIGSGTTGAAVTTAAGATRRPRSRRPLVVAGVIAGLALATTAIVATVSRDDHPIAGTAVVPEENVSVAVLPFANVGRDTLTQYFADGMTDELAAALARTPGMRVAGRRSAYAFKGSTAPARDIGRALGVRYLLDGSVRYAGARVRVSAQLTSAADGLSRWSGSFEGEAREVFALQDSITGAIVEALRLTLARDAGASPGALRLARTPQAGALRTDVLEAHDLYLQGRYEADRHSRAALLRAVELFERAAALDSSYAPPLVGMADAYGWLADSYYPAHDAYAQAKAAIGRALRLAPDLAEAHAVLGWIQLAYDWDADAAARTLHRAVTLDSLSPLAHSNYAYALLFRGDTTGALRHMRRALALDPLSPALSANLEWHLLMQRKYAEAVAQHRVTTRLDSTYFFADSWSAIALRELGRHDDALAEYRAASRRQGGAPLPGLAVTLARMGDTAAARRELERVLEHARRAHVQPDAIAQAYVALGDHDRAFEWLERALRSRSNSLAWIEVHPAFDAIRGDPRYAALVRRVARRRGARA